MSVQTTSNSTVSQFGLHRTIDSRTERFLKLSKRRQIRQGCACAAVTAAITVTIVIVILLIYEYTIVGFLNLNWQRALRLGPEHRPRYITQDTTPTPLLARHKIREVEFIHEVASSENSQMGQKSHSSETQTYEQESNEFVYTSPDFQSKARLMRNFQEMKKRFEKFSDVTDNNNRKMKRKTRYYPKPENKTTSAVKKAVKGKTKRIEVVKRKKINKIKTSTTAKNLILPFYAEAKKYFQKPLSNETKSSYKINCTCNLNYVGGLNDMNSIMPKLINYTSKRPQLQSTKQITESTSTTIKIIVTLPHTMLQTTTPRNIYKLFENKIDFPKENSIKLEKNISKLKVLQYAVVPSAKKIKALISSDKRADIQKESVERKLNEVNNIKDLPVTESLTEDEPDLSNSINTLEGYKQYELIKGTVSPYLDDTSVNPATESTYLNLIRNSWFSMNHDEYDKIRDDDEFD